jgi:alcohol dehydrogenase class IV
VAWVDDVQAALAAQNIMVQVVFSCGEPTVDDLRAGLADLRAFNPDCILAIGGGATLDLGKALAAVIRSDDDPLAHLEIVGQGRPIGPDPLPFIAVPTTSGTGAEATKNAVLTVPDRALKVSLRDDRMLPDLAIIDPALTDHSPKALTLASGLDAITQLIESYLSIRANPVTDALCCGVLPDAIAALVRLMQAENAPARDTLAKASYLSGIALANVGLGVVHGLAAIIGGRGGAHGAICGRILPAALDVNARVTRDAERDDARFRQVDMWLANALGATPATATQALRRFMDTHDLPPLAALGVGPDDSHDFARQAQVASSTKSNPVVLGVDDIKTILDMSA